MQPPPAHSHPAHSHPAHSHPAHSLPAQSFPAQSLLAIPGVQRASALDPPTDEALDDDTARAQLRALRGTITECVPEPGSAHLCLIGTWIAAAHAQGEPAAWVLMGRWLPVADDLRRAGVDPAGLVFVRCERLDLLVPIADRLLRSGAFGLLVIDGPAEAAAGSAQQRLRQLAERHEAAVVWRVEGRSALAGPAVSLRLSARRERRGGGERGIRVVPRALRARGALARLGPIEAPRSPDGL